MNKQSLPTGLLGFARKIRHQSKDERIHNCAWWLATHTPKEFAKYCKKLSQGGLK